MTISREARHGNVSVVLRPTFQRCLSATCSHGHSGGGRWFLLGLLLLVGLSWASSGCYPTLRFEVAGPAVSGLTTVNACPSPVPPPSSSGGVGPSGVVVPAS